MKITLDVKSLLLGVLAAGLMFTAFSFKSTQGQGSGRFSTEVHDHVVVILDTETGHYIIAPSMYDVSKIQWLKGEFYDTFKTGKDNKKMAN
ncbi:hypothetical protein ABIE26_004949 [Pedobacter africanus]|uniref:Uncharacterized protein n=1 Tax=Pedobacter africanus TaxID=151894 RepID=A0ACC6L489_9SPHI|nr:hypothetical protein [Pedobacter africanus]MDR6786230.1 hypothetical protein [Pedobacter africanus]